MQCLKPVRILLSDEERIRRLQNHQLPPEMKGKFMYVPCGKCEACLSMRRMNWFFRLKNETEVAESVYFITLTYDDSKLHSKLVNDNGKLRYVADVNKKDVQDFLKRLRKFLQPFKIRYFLVSEYGGHTLRPHYHMILFNFPEIHKKHIDEIIERTWNNGFVTCFPISDARINYVCSYCLGSVVLPDYLEENFMLCSRKPAIGYNFFDKSDTIQRILDSEDDTVSFVSGNKVNKFRLPRYYADKLLSREFKDKIISKHVAEHAREYKEKLRKQSSWLIDHGYEVNFINLKTPYDGSPMKEDFDKQESFKNRVLKNSKNKEL